MGVGVRLPCCRQSSLGRNLACLALDQGAQRRMLQSAAITRQQAEASTSSSPSPPVDDKIERAPREKHVAVSYISGSTNPHFNLSIEDFLLRRRSDPLALFYRNEPCIVIGRNQNQWSEVDVHRMRELGIKLVRRRSGGGAVYHDLGNTNYSFHMAREDFTRREHAEIVASALNGPPISLKTANDKDLGDQAYGAYVNDRNDICVAVKPHKRKRKGRRGPTLFPEAERKISGSAYKITTNRAYHHGTMLLTSNLGHLGTALRPSRPGIQTKGVASVRAPVMNLQEAFKSRALRIDYSDFFQAVHATWSAAQMMRHNAKWSSMVHIDETNYKELLQDDKDEVLASWNEMETWQWNWGQTPEFTHQVGHIGGRITGLDAIQMPVFESSALKILHPLTLALQVKSGLVQSAEVKSNTPVNDSVQTVLARLQGARYDVLAHAPELFTRTNEGDKKPAWEATEALSHLGFSPGDDETLLAYARTVLAWFKVDL